VEYLSCVVKRQQRRALDGEAALEKEENTWRGGTALRLFRFGLLRIMPIFAVPFRSKNEPKIMLYRASYLTFTISLLCASALFGQHFSGKFADRRIIGLHLGYFASEIRGDFELECHSSLRLGVSLNDKWYTGVRTQVIWARNFETPMGTFYSIGPWVRYYQWEYSNHHRPWDLNIFYESGLFVSNFAFEYGASATYYFPKNGTLYLPFSSGADLWLTQNLSLEVGLQFYYNIGKPWSSHGFGYISFGVNWFLLD